MSLTTKGFETFPSPGSPAPCRCGSAIALAVLLNDSHVLPDRGVRRREHLLFDVPVVGLATIPVLKETNTTVLAIEAGRTLMLDKQPMLEAANAAGIAIIGHE